MQDSNNQVLKYSTTNRDGYRDYKSNPEICQHCPCREQCTKSKDCQKTVTRHVWEDYLEKVEDCRHTPWVKDLYDMRKQKIERVFADAKVKHGFALYAVAWSCKGYDAGHAHFCVHEFEKARKMEEEDSFDKLIFRCFRVHFSRSSSVLQLSVHLYHSANGMVHSWCIAGAIKITSFSSINFRNPSIFAFTCPLANSKISTKIREKMQRCND